MQVYSDHKVEIASRNKMFKSQSAQLFSKV